MNFNKIEIKKNIVIDNDFVFIEIIETINNDQHVNFYRREEDFVSNEIKWFLFIEVNICKTFYYHYEKNRELTDLSFYREVKSIHELEKYYQKIKMGDKLNVKYELL